MLGLGGGLHDVREIGRKHEQLGIGRVVFPRSGEDRAGGVGIASGVGGPSFGPCFLGLIAELVAHFHVSRLRLLPLGVQPGGEIVTDQGLPRAAQPRVNFAERKEDDLVGGDGFGLEKQRFCSCGIGAQERFSLTDYR